MIKQMKLKREFVAAKSEQKIRKFQETMGDHVTGHLTALQPVIPPSKSGKRVFEGDKLKDTDVIRHDGFDRVFARRTELEFPNHYNSQAELPSKKVYKVDQDYLIPYLQTKNKLSNKFKKRVSEDYIKRMLGVVGLTDRRAAIVKALQEESIDIRMINNLKGLLLDSSTTEGNLIPVADYLKIKEKVFKGRTTNADSLLFDEIKGA
jgi:hypothetical protein